MSAAEFLQGINMYKRVKIYRTLHIARILLFEALLMACTKLIQTQRGCDRVHRLPTEFRALLFYYAPLLYNHFRLFTVQAVLALVYNSL